MKHLQAFVMFAVIALLYGCKTDAVRDDVPARITDPTEESRAELLGVVSDALNCR